jgi:Holliday junction resolvase RusA-like endonuclease
VATLISADGREWFKAVDAILVEKQLPLIQGLVKVEIRLEQPDRRVIDPDNRIKAVLDSLKRRKNDEKQRRWLFADDDAQCDDVRAYRGGMFPGGRCIVTITPIPQAQGSLFEEAERA